MPTAILMSYNNIFTDTFTASDGTTWDTNWYTGFSTSTEEPKVNGNKGRIITDSVANRYGAGTTKLPTSDSRAKTEFVATITKDSASRQYMMTLGVNTNGGNGSSGGKFTFNYGVWFETPGDGTGITMYAKDSGGTTVSQASTQTWAVGAEKNIRFRYDGENVLLKVWTGTEPEHWTDKWVPSVTVGAGFTFFGVHTSASGASLGATNGVFIDSVSINDGAGVVDVQSPAGTSSSLMPAVGVDPLYPIFDDLDSYVSGDWTTVDATLSHTGGFIQMTGTTLTNVASYNKVKKAASRPSQFIIAVKPNPQVTSSTVKGLLVGRVRFCEDGVVRDNHGGFGTVSYDRNEWYLVRTTITESSTSTTVWKRGTSEPSPQISGGSTLFNSEVGTSIRTDKTSAVSETHLLDYFYVNRTGATLVLPDADVTSTPATGSALIPAPIVVTQGNVIVPVTPATGSSLMVPGTFVDGIVVSPDVLVVSANMPSPTVSTLLSAVIPVTPAGSSSVMVLPVEFQGSENDPYFQRVSTQVDSDDWWFRLDETSGTVAENEIGTPEGSFVGSPAFNIGAPEGRRYVSLSGTGQYIQFPTNDRLINEWSFEATFRTTKQDQVITGAFDNIVGDFGVTGQASFLETSGGKLKWLGHTGLKTVSDGEWHHVVLWVKNDVWRFYVDGKLDIQRFKSSGPTSTPDTFGGPGTYLESSVLKTADIPSSMYFQGDVMEIVQRQNYALDPTDITRNYYSVFGIVPKEAPTAQGSVSMPGPTVRGNTKRAILVYSGINIDPVTGYYDETTFDASTGDFDFGPFLKLTQNTDLAGYKFFPVRLTNINLKDEVTDLQRFIDFTVDVDLSDIDLIVFRDVPDEGYERAALLNINVSENVIVNQSYIEQAWERMIVSLRAAVDSGVSLLVTSPRLATDLGIINSAQVHTQGREALFGAQNQGNATGSYDYRSAAITPFGTDSGHSPSYDGMSSTDINNLAKFFYDTHRINRYRVVATISGLTDIPSYIRTETVNFTPSDNFRVGRFADKFSYRPDGLLIGDEFVIDWMKEGVQLRDYTSANFLDRKARRDSYVLWSVPPEAVQAGKVVTTLASTYWQGTQEVANPYANNATTIVLEPGDPLNGRPVGGKVFVNFTEEPIFTKPDYRKQVVPTSAETAEQREWDYSSWRWTVQYTSISVPGQTSGTSDESNTGSSPSTQLSTISLYEQYPTVALNVETMITRALSWLGDRIVTEGATVIRVPAATALAEMPDTSNVAGRSVQVKAKAALGGATLNAPQGTGKSVLLVTFPAEATGVMPVLPTIINVLPATASGTMSAFNTIAAGGEQVVLYMFNTEATLFMKEEN